MPSFDLFVIGTGPAGLNAALTARKLGLSAGIAEKREVVGGVCVNTGTIPSKTFREAVLYLTGYRHKGVYGEDAWVKEEITASDLLSRCAHVIAREVEVTRERLRHAGVAVLTGQASFVDPRTLTVTNARGEAERVTAESVVIAVGSVPAAPPGVPVDGETVITSDGILSLAYLPRTLTVVGGGVVGVEYASMFAALGVEVTLVDRQAKLLDFVDDEISESLSYQMRDLGTTFRMGEEVASVAVEKPGRAVATLRSGKRIVSELLLYAVGRVGATDGLNLAAAGLAPDARGRLAVDAQYRTSVPNVFAAGDVVGFPALASTSMEQGRLAAHAAAGAPCESFPKLFPYGVYSIPELSMVGPTEEELTKQGVPYETGVGRYRQVARGAILGDDTGLLKMIFHRETRKLLAVHAIGTAATELIHVGQAVLALGGGLDYFLGAVFNYPTFAEAYKVAALDAEEKLTG